HSGGATFNIAEYSYDPFGRRLWKNVDADLDGVYDTKTYFLYSDEGLIAEFDAEGYQTKAYGYALGAGWTTAPLYQKEQGNYYWYLNDHLGTPQKLTDSAGAVVWAAVYDSFGKAHLDIEHPDVVNTVENNLRFAGQYYDAETELHYNWNRYYDPGFGRYLRTDPLGLDGGINVYAYVNNNPLMFVDPEGLRPLNTGLTSINSYNSYRKVQNLELSTDLSSINSYSTTRNRIQDLTVFGPDPDNFKTSPPPPLDTSLSGVTSSMYNDFTAASAKGAQYCADQQVNAGDAWWAPTWGVPGSVAAAFDPETAPKSLAVIGTAAGISGGYIAASIVIESELILTESIILYESLFVAEKVVGYLDDAKGAFNPSGWFGAASKTVDAIQAGEFQP
ncbi:MAG: hypothetical protein D3922_08540, partial [Candidatus Electrothrix sp. AR1]|nr:hypothetical protein [Candidatus Electrothrix sp. AR1]